VQNPEKPDLIYVTSLYTWAWRPIWHAVRFYKSIFEEAEVWLGGLYASLMPEHAANSGADQVHMGVFEEAEGRFAGLENEHGVDRDFELG
jgi:hypothetical protein